MPPSSLPAKIRAVRASIIAIGWSPEPNRMNITGSGFCAADDGAILTAAHIYGQTPPEFRDKLMGMAMVKQEVNDLEHYGWFPLELLRKDDKDDLAVFRLASYAETLMKPLELGGSDEAEVGDETYFIGFPYAANLMNEGFGITLIANRGMLSNVKRDGRDPAHPRNWFIVDAISNPGNSGCPLMDAGTNKVIGVMNIAFRTKSRVKEFDALDIREPMHIAGAKPIALARPLLGARVDLAIDG